MDPPPPPPGEGEGPPPRRGRPGTGYDRDRSRHTAVPLTDAELARVMAAAARADLGAWFPGFEAAHLIEFVYLTGAHPDVIAHPGRYDLRTEGRNGHLHVIWGRPKKRGVYALTDLPVVRSDAPAASWLPGWVRGLRAHTYGSRHLNRLCHLVGKEAGVPFSLRTLRHCCGVRIARKARDPARVQAWLNCSAQVALQYTRIASADDPRMLELAEG